MDGVICDAVSKTGARRVFAAYFSVKKFCFLSSLVKERSGSSLVKERHLGLNMPRSGRDKKWRNALKELEARGEEAYERKDYAEAISHFSNASNLNPKEMNFIYKIGKIHLEQGNYAEGISSFSKAINVGKEHGKNVKMVAKAYVRRGKAFKEMGKTDKFEEDMGKALKYLKVVAQLRFDNEVWDECLDFCQRAREIGEEIGHVDEEFLALESKATTRMSEATRAKDLRKLGNDAYKQLDFHTALKHYYEAKKMDPREITILNNIAAVKFEQEKYDECVKICDEAINIGKIHKADSEKMKKARDRRCRAQKLLHKSKAEEEISEMMDNVDIVADAEKNRFKEFKVKEGTVCPVPILPIDPCHLKAAEDASNLGDEAFNKKDLDVALKHYEKARELNPGEMTYLKKMAAVKYEQKKYDECMDVCDEAVKVGKRDPANKKEIEKVLELQDAANKFIVDRYEERVRTANAPFVGEGEEFDDNAPSEESRNLRVLLKLSGLDDELEKASESARDYIQRKVETKLLKAEENASSATAPKLPKDYKSHQEFQFAMLEYLEANDLSPLHPTVLLEVAKALSEKKNFMGCCTFVLYFIDQLPKWTDERYSKP